jgi:hypothetical protein
MKTVCEVLGVSRSNLAVKSKREAEWVDKRKTRGGAAGSDSQIEFISGSAGVIKLPI